jgi:hypothetical protein
VLSIIKINRLEGPIGQMLMTKNFKKILCICLAIITIVGVMAGCGDGVKKTEPTVSPGEQLFADTYERNDLITENLTYSIDYITSTSSYSTNMEIVSLFDHTKVQVDGWDPITMGISTMGEIVSIVNKANDAAGETKPYTYTVTIGKSNKAVPGEYQPTLLIDPNKNNILFFDVAKYGIPYVRFEFMAVNYLYNTKITQESDWVVNGMGSAYVPAPSKKNEAAPDYRDVDGRNKAAKQNIVLSGDIALGGDGFTWDSLMTMCNALQLTEGSREHGFIQSSDKDFTYYTITWSANPYEIYGADTFTNETVVFPQTRLVATFDPLTQTCLNWTVDTYSSPLIYKKRVHDVTEPIKVNVKEYQVDIKNYEAMRETIRTWIINNSEKVTMQKCILDTSLNVVGDIASATPNNSQLGFDDTKYHFVKVKDESSRQKVSIYISDYHWRMAQSIQNKDDREKYINENSEDWIIAYRVLDKKGNDLGLFIDGEPFLQETYGDSYYVVHYGYDNGTYKDLSILSYESANKLLMLYTKTYRLNAEQNAQIQTICGEEGLMAVKTYVDQLFAEAEKEQENKASA